MFSYSDSVSDFFSLEDFKSKDVGVAQSWPAHYSI